MELEENKIPEEQGDEAVEIYSKKAIFWFSIFPSSIFGSILLMLNLKAAGYKKELFAVLIFTILYYFVASYALAGFVQLSGIDLLAYQEKFRAYKGGPNPIDGKIILLLGAFIALNIIGGLILTQYFFKKYFPEEDYYPKSIVMPLIIFILIIGLPIIASM